MKRIRFINRVPHVIDKNQFRPYPIPPYPYVVREEVELVTRLRSTRGRRAADWWVGEGAEGALNGAPFNPVIRAVVTGFLWIPPFGLPPSGAGRFYENPIRLDWEAVHRGTVDNPCLVIQTGTEVPNWEAHVVRPLPDPGRDVIRAAWIAAQQKGYGVWEQGHLQVIGVTREHIVKCLIDLGAANSPEEADRLISRLLERSSGASGDRWFYNHLFYNSFSSFFRVIDTEEGETAVGLLRVWGTPCYILSPDHPNAPIVLRDEGLYVFVHPLPLQQEGVD